jgi:hypothetical protein
MTSLETHAPQFVKNYTPQNGGTDFLGMRQVNVEMMDACLPGINNVCRFVRPFSVISWIYWKLYEDSQAADGEVPTKRKALEWQEKVETLFTWGHALEGISGIPGIQAMVPKGNRVPLDFESWHRIRESTSLLAAIQYGPPAKVGNGLGFIRPTNTRSVFCSSGLGVGLAKALDEHFHRAPVTRVASILKSSTATAEDAKILFPLWSVKSPSLKEQSIFRQAFYDRSQIGSDAAMGRRSGTLQLILSALEYASKPMTADDVRAAIFHQHFLKSDRKDRDLEKAWRRWMILQLRQAQRIAMEGLLAWVERRIIWNRDQSLEPMTEAFQDQWRGAAKHIVAATKIGQLKSRLRNNARSLEDLITRSEKDHEDNIFYLMSSLLSELEKDVGLAHLIAFRILLLIPTYIELLSEKGNLEQMLQNGGPQRISLRYWIDFLTTVADSSLPEFFTLLLENYIVSQHLAVAAGRFDGNAQRLRISLEEEGLSALVREPLYPRVTPDRLWIALSLMADCDMVKADPQRELFHAA